MIVSLLAASTLAAAPVPARPDPSILTDAARAIDAGRLEEAKQLITRAVSTGASGAQVDRIMARLAFASHKYTEALAGYQRLAASPQKQPGDCENGAIAALELGKAADAKPLVDCAIAPANASWRAWNARGVLADFNQDWKAADEAYSRAHQLAPAEAKIINNEGWSMLLRGDWAGAIPFFEQAVSIGGASERLANNLELAKAALAADLPKRQPGETDHDWATRLNDAGVAASLLGEKQRAVAAFTQALDADPTWYVRASNNLKAMSPN
jgi:tetratricopeptide (TPR) repeat protein